MWQKKELCQELFYRIIENDLTRINCCNIVQTQTAFCAIKPNSTKLQQVRTRASKQLISQATAEITNAKQGNNEMREGTRTVT